MLTFLHSLFSNLAYDEQGRFFYLLGRANEPALCRIDGVPMEQVARALSLFCSAFDVPDEQRFCLRPSDRLTDIYRAMVGSRRGDDMEFERLTLELQEEIGRPLRRDECAAIRTIEDLARFLGLHPKRL